MTSPLRSVEREDAEPVAASGPTLELEIGVVIPAFQAEATIADVVARTLPICRRLLVVDDGSLDATALRAREAGAQVLSHPRNLGKGAALRHGFEQLLGEGDLDGIVTLDADGQHEPEQIPRLVAGAYRARADLVLGGRDHLFDGMVFDRRWSNRISSASISFLASQRLRDVQTGFRFYSRRLLATVPMLENRFEAESAIVVRAGRRGLRIVSVPIEIATVDGRSTSHFRPFRDAARIVVAIVRACFDFDRRRPTR